MDALLTTQLTDRAMRLLRKTNVERLSDEPQGLSEGVGRTFFVDSGSSRAASTNTGLEPYEPFATIAQAVNAAVADRGDVIMVAAGHAETLTTALSINKAGVTIQGMGNRRNRPTLTIGAVIDGVSIAAANVRFGGFYFAGPTAAATAFIDIAAADAEVFDCEFIADGDATEVITIPDAGDRAFIHDCIFRITANGPTKGVSFESASTDGVTLKNLRSFSSSVANAWDNGFIYGTAAHTGCHIEDIWNDFGPTLIFTAAATGYINNVWPGEISETASGWQLVGGACMLTGGPDEGYRGNKATADLFPGASATDILTIASGRMLLKNLLMEVTTIVQNQATTLKFVANPTNTGNTTNDLCATVDMDADKVGSLYSLDGVAATALVRGETGGVTMGSHMGNGIAINPGSIDATAGADSTGSVKIAVWVKKIDPACIWSWTA